MSHDEPNVKDGIDYWTSQPANYDGVLGGYGTGPLPRIDALGSRLFLLYLFPELSSVPSAIKPIKYNTNHRRTRALDVGAGVGRVTCDVLLHLVSDVLLLEPVTPFFQEALSRARASSNDPSFPHVAWKGLADRSRSVTFMQGTLQDFDPAHPLSRPGVRFQERLGFQPQERSTEDIDSGFDVIWCQWCLGHLNDVDLTLFLKRCQLALRSGGKSMIMVKENVCSDGSNGEARSSFDEQDSSVTRSDALWKSIFKKSGLKLVDERVQDGLPMELYEVKMYALR